MDVTLVELASFLTAEIYLFISTVLLLCIGLYGGDKRHDLVASITPVLLIVAAYFLARMPSHGSIVFLNDMVETNDFIRFSKLLVLAGALLTVGLSYEWMNRVSGQIFEFYILLLLATIGLMLMVSAANMLALYLAVELASLSLYILAAFRRDSLRSTESGLKYFVLGSLASGILLFGISLVYGFTGSISFDGIRHLLAGFDLVDGKVAPFHTGALVGMVMVIIGLCFKVSAVPFHMWTPDVYEGAPTPVTAFFATAPKVAALVLFSRVLLEPFGHWHEQWQQIIIVVSIASMLVGAFGALVQTSIKRMLAYSSIGHVGYALMALAAGTPEGMQGLLVYLAIYMFMSAGAFGCVLLLQRNGEGSEDIAQLSGLSQRHPYLAIFFTVFMFSLAGIPPLAGFFGKFYVFMAALKAGLEILAIIGVLSSVVAAFYYLRLVKLMYFDEEKEAHMIELTLPMKYLLTGCAGVTLLFFLYPAPLIEITRLAANALWS